MNRRLLVIASVALLVSLAVTFIAYRVARNQLSASTQVQKFPQVVVAAHDLEVGTVLRAQDLTTTDWPGSLAKGMNAKPEPLVGRGVVAPIYSGEPVLETRLAALGSGGGLAATIPPGMRACAVKVNDVVGVAGFVTPGMRVDVLIASSGGSSAFGVSLGNSGTKVKTLLQNLEVLSAGTDIARDVQGKPAQVQVVNLLVTPDQAEILSLANAETRIQLVLRNPLDTKIAQTSGAVLSRLFSDNDFAPQANTPTPAPARSPAPPVVRRTAPRPPVFPDMSGMMQATAPAMSQPEPKAAAPVAVEVIYGAKRSSEGGK